MLLGKHTVHLNENYRIYSRNFLTLGLFYPQKRVRKIMRGIFGRRCFRGDFQVRSRIRYPIHKLEIKRFRVII
jgi:hypothetical protein